MLEQRILSVLVLLTLFHPDLTEPSSVCKDEKSCGCLKDRNLHIKSVYTNAEAVISCPNLEQDEELISASLYKEETELHFTDMRNDSHQTGQKFKISQQDFAVSYIFGGIESNDTGIYTCKIKTNLGGRKNKTILLIKDDQTSTDATETHLYCPSTQSLVLYVVYGIIILYNLIITVLVCFFACKLKHKKTPENPYINTRPITFRRC